jgi:hypothetical protein
MSDQETPVGREELQFDSVTTQSASSTPPGAPAKLAVTCGACRTSIETEYYHINGNVFCGRCRTALESAAETPRGLVPLISAGVFGLGAGILGAVIYYAVMVIAHLEIGIVAILIGYMVGYAVRKGARGRGGLRFQVVAVLLTYASVALAYAPIAFKQAIAERNAQRAQAPVIDPDSRTVAGADSTIAATRKPGAGRVGLALLLLLFYVGALPVLVIVGSFPSGLIGALIIFIGMRQAWRMTAAPVLEILGPYRVGATPVSTPA